MSSDALSAARGRSHELSIYLGARYFVGGGEGLDNILLWEIRPEPAAEIADLGQRVRELDARIWFAEHPGPEESQADFAEAPARVANTPVSAPASLEADHLAFLLDLLPGVYLPRQGVRLADALAAVAIAHGRDAECRARLEAIHDVIWTDAAVSEE